MLRGYRVARLRPDVVAGVTVAAIATPESLGYAFLAVMAVARLGFLADLIPQPVLAGFLSGVGVPLVIGKLPAMLGVDASGTTWDKLVATVEGLGAVNLTSAGLAAGVVLIMP